MSLILGPLGSASKLLFPKALGPNSALPLAIPIISPFNSKLQAFLIGYLPLILVPKKGPSQFICSPYTAAAAPNDEPASPGLGIIQVLS